MKKKTTNSAINRTAKKKAIKTTNSAINRTAKKKAIKTTKELSKMKKDDIIGFIQYITPKINAKKKKLKDFNPMIGSMYENEMMRTNAIKFNNKSLDGNVGTFSKNTKNNGYTMTSKTKELSKLTANQLKRYAKSLYNLFNHEKLGTIKKAKQYLNDRVEKSWQTCLRYLPTNINVEDIEPYKEAIMYKFFEKRNGNKYGSDGDFLTSVDEVIGNELGKEQKTLQEAIEEAKENEEIVARLLEGSEKW